MDAVETVIRSVHLCSCSFNQRLPLRASEISSGPYMAVSLTKDALRDMDFVPSDDEVDEDNSGEENVPGSQEIRSRVR